MDENSHVLVVDDDTETLTLLREILSKEGYDVGTAMNGKMALDHIGSRPPDLVMSDIHMPDLDGMGLLAELRNRHRFDNLVGSSPGIVSVYKSIARVAHTDSTVLLQGESGTGKELIARALHANSGRSAGPFVAVDGGSLAETLLESELFGHERGSFTGAVTSKKGLLEK